MLDRFLAVVGKPLPMSKRDLAKLQITLAVNRWSDPCPLCSLLRVKLALQKG